MNEGHPGQAPQQNDSNWQYVSDQPQQYAPGIVQQAPPAPATEVDEISWTASEFVAHHKGVGWYLLMILAAVVTIGVVYLVVRDAISVGVIVALFVLFGISAARKPRVLEYRLDQGGLTIGSKFYPYNGFKSFSIIREGAFSSISLLPLKRFMPPLSIYYEPKDEPRIIEVISAHLPFEERGNDPLDRFVRLIRF